MGTDATREFLSDSMLFRYLQGYMGTGKQYLGQTDKQESLDTFKDIWELFSGNSSSMGSSCLDTFKDIWEPWSRSRATTAIERFRYLQGYMGTEINTMPSSPLFRSLDTFKDIWEPLAVFLRCSWLRPV